MASMLSWQSSSEQAVPWMKAFLFVFGRLANTPFHQGRPVNSSADGSNLYGLNQLTIEDALFEALHVVGGDIFWVGQGHGNLHGHCHLIYPQIGIGGNDCPSSEVNTLPAEVSPESALLALQALHKTPACSICSTGGQGCGHLVMMFHLALAEQKAATARACASSERQPLYLL